jgi:hypothetical protein
MSQLCLHVEKLKTSAVKYWKLLFMSRTSYVCIPLLFKLVDAAYVRFGLDTHVSSCVYVCWFAHFEKILRQLNLEWREYMKRT